MRKSRKCVDKESQSAVRIGSKNIFKDLGFSEADAVNLHARGELALAIKEIILENDWSQRRAAAEMGVPQPRIAEIMSMKLDLYSVDKLLKYLDKLDRKVSFVVERKVKIA